MKLLMVKEIALELGKSESTIRRWMGKKKIPYIKLYATKHATVRFDVEKVKRRIND